MSDTRTLAAIRRLTPDRIRARLDELAAERKSLMVLLRAARAAESSRRPTTEAAR